MLAEALQKFADLVKTETYYLKDRKEFLSSRQLFNLPLPEEPLYPTVDLISLKGFADFVKTASGNFICCKAQNVELLTTEFGTRRQRDVLARATCKVQPFNFGNFVSMETFRIELMTRFVGSADLDTILEFTGKLTAESAASLTDNGIAQSLTVKAGIATMAPVNVPTPCRLSPVRTFREIEQPEGVFILRLRKGASGGIEAALFEHFTDWEKVAALRVAEYLADTHGAELGNTPIFA